MTKDAYKIDTTNLTIKETFNKIRKIIDKKNFNLGLNVILIIFKLNNFLAISMI